MKYMGSKARIAKHILPIILKDRQEGQWYVEPFVGGANMIDKVDGNRIGADSNEYLIAFYNAMQSGWQLPEVIDNELFQKVKSDKESFPMELVGAIGICFTFGAKWFGGFVGNATDRVCLGRDRIGESRRAVEKARAQVSGIDIRLSSFDELDIPPQSIIYCDPPYAGTTKYKDDFDHEKFWQWCREKCAEGHSVFISEYNAPDDFACVWSGELAVSVQKSGAKKATERLFVHKSQV